MNRYEKWLKGEDPLEREYRLLGIRARLASVIGYMATVALVCYGLLTGLSAVGLFLGPIVLVKEGVWLIAGFGVSYILIMSFWVLTGRFPWDRKGKNL